MARPPRPWYRAASDAWYTTVGGKQRMLARGKANRKAAEREFHRLMAGVETPRPEASRKVAVLLDLFLDHVQSHNAPATYTTYREYARSFADQFGDLAASDIRPRHVAAWWAAHPKWGTSRRHVGLSVIKRALNWAEREGYLGGSPLRLMPAPQMKARTRLLAADEVARMRSFIADDNFRDFFDAMVESGCRPGEAAKVEARHVDLDAATWTLEFKGNPARVVYLTPALVAICRRRMAEHPAGPIFRTRAGTPWRRHAYSQRIRRLRRKAGLGDDVTAYLLRHYFATDALEKEVPVATVAELLGHKDTKMLAKHYSKLSKKHEYLRNSLNKIRPGEPGEGGDAG